MNSNSRIIFITFTDNRYKLTLERVEKEIKTFPCFDEYYLLTEDDFEDDYINKYRDRFRDRGFGYWMWKSYLAKKYLSNLKEDDILVYCDAGCTLNNKGLNRMIEYIELVKKNETGLLFFDQQNYASEWTKGDVFDFFGVYNKPEFTESSQLYGGIWIIRKTEKSVEFIDRLYDIDHNNYDLISDKPSVMPNLPNFVAHRYDQSVFSLLSRFYKCEIISSYETYPLNDDWKSMVEFPIWANRKKRMTKINKIIHRLKLPVRLIRRYFNGYIDKI